MQRSQHTCDVVITSVQTLCCLTDVGFPLVASGFSRTCCGSIPRMDFRSVSLIAFLPQAFRCRLAVQSWRASHE